MKLTEKIQAVRELPNQMKFSFNLALSGLIVATIALVLSIVLALSGVRRAN